MNQLPRSRQEVLYAMAVDRMGVSPADFHELVVPVGVGERGDLGGHCPSYLTVPELVHVLHRESSSRGATRPMATPPCVSRTSPVSTGATSSTAISARFPAPSSQRASYPSSEITRTGMPASEQVTHPSWSNVQYPDSKDSSSRTATLSGRPLAPPAPARTPRRSAPGPAGRSAPRPRRAWTWRSPRG